MKYKSDIIIKYISRRVRNDFRQKLLLNIYKKHASDKASLYIAI